MLTYAQASDGFCFVIFAGQHASYIDTWVNCITLNRRMTGL